MKIWQYGLGLLSGLGVAVWARNYQKNFQKTSEQLAKQHEEIDAFIKEHEAYLASLANERSTCTVVMKDGTEMDFGDYLDQIVGPWIEEQINSEES